MRRLRPGSNASEVQAARNRLRRLWRGSPCGNVRCQRIIETGARAEHLAPVTKLSHDLAASELTMIVVCGHCLPPAGLDDFPREARIDIIRMIFPGQRFDFLMNDKRISILQCEAAAYFLEFPGMARKLNLFDFARVAMAWKSTSVKTVANVF